MPHSAAIKTPPHKPDDDDMRDLQTITATSQLPQAAMIRALTKTLVKNGSFGDAFAVLNGFKAETLPDGIQVGTHAAHKTGAVIGPTIAALACANASAKELAQFVGNMTFQDMNGTGVTWDYDAVAGVKRASATYPVTHKTNLQITCVDEAVEPYFDGRQYSGATVILQLIQAPKRSLH